MKKTIIFIILASFCSFSLIGENSHCKEFLNYIEQSKEMAVFNLSVRFGTDLAECGLNGNGPLHVFAEHSTNFAIFSSLIHLVNADPVGLNAAGENPLIVAISKKNQAAAKYLLNLPAVRADINIKSAEGKSAIMWAVEHECGACYQLLCDFLAEESSVLRQEISRDEHNHNWQEKKLKKVANIIPNSKGSIQ